MKKTPKQVLGLVGLGVVATATAFAASIPKPEVLAAEATSITDTITVRVVGSEPNITITSPLDETGNGIVFVEPSINIDFNYENVDTIHQLLVYTDKDGNKTTFDDGTFTPIITDYTAGDGRTVLDLSNYGYGNYIFNVKGTHLSAEPTEDIVEFNYLPLTMFVEETDDGKLIANFEYNPANVCSASINVYDGDKLVTPPSPIIIDKLTTKYALPLNRTQESAKGTYTFETTAYGCDAPKEPLYTPYVSTFDYENIYVPDTGSLLNKLNISKIDYLATGLLLFFAFATLGLVFTIKKRNYRVAHASRNVANRAPRVTKNSNRTQNVHRNMTKKPAAKSKTSNSRSNSRTSTAKKRR